MTSKKNFLVSVLLEAKNLWSFISHARKSVCSWKINCLCYKKINNWLSTNKVSIAFISSKWVSINRKTNELSNPLNRNKNRQNLPKNELIALKQLINLQNNHKICIEPCKKGDRTLSPCLVIISDGDKIPINKFFDWDKLEPLKIILSSCLVNIF